MQLASVILPDEMVWVDKYQWSKIKSSAKRTLEGKLHMRESLLPSDAGRPITLESDFAWASQSVVDSLQTLSQLLGNIMTLTFNDNSTIQVKFRHWEPPVLSATMVVDTAFPTVDTLYKISLRLMVA
jgi:hypothetical protein